MKARVVSNEYRQAEKTAKMVWEINKQCILDTRAVILASIKEFFGLGRKRMTEFMAYLSEREDDFGKYADEGIFEYKLSEILDGVIDIRSEITNNETLGEAISRLELANRPDITRDEAKRIHTAMCEMKQIGQAMEAIRQERVK